MKYSQLFGKTVVSSPRGVVGKSADLLYRGGFIRESSSGRYFLLPLGMRVHRKIEAVIREEMNKVGAQEMVAPVLHPIELWKETNRTNTAGFELTKVKDRRGAEFALGGTAEEMFVDVVRKFQLSYKDLPFNLYQFSQKFRDELRARGGLLRVREFVMKDAYSFHADEEDFKKEYGEMASIYKTIFDRVGLSTVMVEADNGYIGGEYCHEFVVESDAGESSFLVSDGGGYCAHEEVAKFARGQMNPGEKQKRLEEIGQPEWVKTMDDNVKHYGYPGWRYLKNVVYKNKTSGEIVIGVIRGDLEVNKTKLEHVVGAVGQLEDADIKDLTGLGTKPGYVHSWGHKGARYVGDLSLETVINFIGGQKEEKTDTVNVNYGRDFKCDLTGDIASAGEGFLSEQGKRLRGGKGIEVGNIFQLGFHYTRLMKGATFVDQDGAERPYYMGCYGIGLGRTMAAVVEVHHDEKGIVWPGSIAPFNVHLVDLREKEKAGEVYRAIASAGVEVLWDDREGVSPGKKLVDCDLIGIPVRLVVSARTGDQIEWRERRQKKPEMLSLEEALKRLKGEI